MMSGGWVVRIHRSPRSRLFHPIHRSRPVQPQDLEAQRVTVIWYSGTRGWERVVQEDIWQNGQVPPAAPVSGTWRSWTFFRLAESPQSGQNSSGIPRIQPDSIVWNQKFRASLFRDRLAAQVGHIDVLRLCLQCLHGDLVVVELVLMDYQLAMLGLVNQRRQRQSSFSHGSLSVAGTGGGYDWRQPGTGRVIWTPSSTSSPTGSYAPPCSVASRSLPMVLPPRHDQAWEERVEVSMQLGPW